MPPKYGHLAHPHIRVLVSLASANHFKSPGCPKMILCVLPVLTHWGRVTHICVGKLTTIGSVNGLSPGRRQAIIWTNAGILLIGPLGTNFSETLNGIQTFSFKKMHLKMSSAKWRPSCLGLNVLNAVDLCGCRGMLVDYRHTNSAHY